MTVHIGYTFRALESIRTSAFLGSGNVQGETNALPRLQSLQSEPMRVVIKAVWLKFLEPVQETKNLMLRMSPQTCGQSSMIWSQDISRSTDSKPLIQAGVVAVRVGPDGPMPFPELYRTRFKSYVQTYQHLQCHPPPPVDKKDWQVPVGAFVADGRVSAHHIDRNQHMNQSNYVEAFHDVLIDYLIDNKKNDLRSNLESFNG